MKICRRLTGKLLILKFSILFLLTSFSTFGFSTEYLKFDKEVFSKEINDALLKYDIPGSAIAILNKDSIWIGTYGYADVNRKLPISDKTVFRIGSISKSYLAIAIMQLVDEGKIDLHDPVNKYISDIKISSNRIYNH